MLCTYTNSTTDKVVWGVLEFAEQISSTICEKCGSQRHVDIIGTSDGPKTLCSKCDYHEGAL